MVSNLHTLVQRWASYGEGILISMEWTSYGDEHQGLSLTHNTHTHTIHTYRLSYNNISSGVVSFSVPFTSKCLNPNPTEQDLNLFFRLSVVFSSLMRLSLCVSFCLCAVVVDCVSDLLVYITYVTNTRSKIMTRKIPQTSFTFLKAHWSSKVTLILEWYSFLNTCRIYVCAFVCVCAPTSMLCVCVCKYVCMYVSLIAEWCGVTGGEI